MRLEEGLSHLKIGEVYEVTWHPDLCPYIPAKYLGPGDETEWDGALMGLMAFIPIQESPPEEFRNWHELNYRPWNSSDYPKNYNRGYKKMVFGLNMHSMIKLPLQVMCY